MITGELIPWAIGVIGAVIGALAFVSRQRAETARLRAERDKLIAQTQLKEVEGEAEAKKADAETVKNLIIANQQFADHLRQLVELRHKDNERAEANYRVFTRVSNENARVVLEEIKAQGSRIIEEIRSLPTRVETVNADALQTILAEIAVTFSQQFALHSARSKLHYFPDPDHPGWRREFIHPLSPGAIIHKEPYLDDASQLKKSCSAINSNGEWCWIVEDAVPDWVAIEKVENDRSCWGWIYSKFIQIGQPEATPAT